MFRGCYSSLAKVEREDTILSTKKMFKYPEKYDMIIKEHFSQNKFRQAISPHVRFLLRCAKPNTSAMLF